MKTRYLWSLAVSILLATTNSFAQNSENSNPYAIFGCTPYVAGDKDAGASAENVFVIENFAKGSKVARIEHNPQTGRVRLLNKRGKLLKEKLLKACENGWLTQDRKAEKYYSISPYAFCAGNPIRYIDPNGEEIWIYYQDDNGNEQKMLYTANMEYKGSNFFVGNMVSNLNAVYSNGGNAMLDILIGSENAFNVLNQDPSVDGAAGTFRRNMNGGGTIFAGKIGGATNFETVETTAHEFFHGIQHEMGQGGRSVFNEVEAMVFGNSVAVNWSFDNGGGGSITSMGILDTPAGQAYETAFRKLQWGGYSHSAMVDAINNFQTGAYVNFTGTYNNMRILPTPYSGGKVKSLLSGLHPNFRKQ